jgi:hypothetical protein
MKTIRVTFFSIAGGSVVAVYTVTPLAVSLRPLLSGLLVPVLVALVVISACAARIISVLHRTAPFADAAPGLLAMPILETANLGKLPQGAPADVTDIPGQTHTRPRLAAGRTPERRPVGRHRAGGRPIAVR